MAREYVLTLQCSKRREQDLEVKIELNKIIAAHEEVQQKKKIRNKQVDRIEATLDQTRLLEEILLRMEFITTKEDLKVRELLKPPRLLLMPPCS